MSEEIRDISAVIDVDTNKKTITRHVEADSINQLKERLIAEIDDIEEELNSG